MAESTFAHSRRLGAECLGTAALLATVVGSGIMAENLAGGNVAIALLGNTVATGAMLFVLITMLGPISGAHFNPAVSLAFAAQKQLGPHATVSYIGAQVLGAIIGVWAAHLMFDQSVWQLSSKARSGGGQFLSEIIATFGLVLTIFATIRSKPSAVPAAVGLYITAAYWFTASTSFANPAVTIARALSDSFAGISPSHVAPFILAQLLGALLAVGFVRWLFGPQAMKTAS